MKNTALSRIIALTVLSWLSVSSAYGHAKGEDYIFINIEEQGIVGEFQINIDELRDKLGIDIPKVGSVDVDVLRKSETTVYNYIEQNFSIGPQQAPPFQIGFTGVKIGKKIGKFVTYPFRIKSESIPDKLTIRHNMFYEGDRNHRGLLLVQYNAKTDINYGEEHTALIFNPNNQVQELDLNNVPGLLRMRQMIIQGMWHIWIGIDHILFLLALILPTVLVRKHPDWHPVGRPASSVRSLLAIVTVFTLAHSITLFLAAFNIVQVGERLVESVIALSIAVVALNNIFQWVSKGSLFTIFFLGLFHGLGFASVMGNLPFRMVDLVGMVIMFNIGVELGQIAIVIALFPILYWLRTNNLYIPIVLKGGSWLLSVIGFFWFTQRVMGL
ncbi:MAG: HupE/UreJ family protein [bacterium]